MIQRIVLGGRAFTEEAKIGGTSGVCKGLGLRLVYLKKVIPELLKISLNRLKR